MKTSTPYWEYKEKRAISYVRVILRKVVIPLVQFIPSWRVRNLIWRICGASIHPTAWIARNVLLDEEAVELITIEEEALISYGVILLAHKREGMAPVKIGKGSYIGAGAIVLPGVTIGSYAEVGAGSVVTKDVLPGATVAGSPAEMIKSQRWETFIQPNAEQIFPRPDEDKL